MKKQAVSIMLAVLLCFIFSVSSFAQNPPENFKNEYIGMDSDKDEIYNDDQDWNIYYSFVDSKSFLEYILDLQKSGYQFVDSKPQFIKDYEIKGANPLFDKKEQVTVKMAKQDYSRILITYFNYAGVTNPNSFEYTMSVKINMGNEPTTQPTTTEQTTKKPSSTKPIANHEHDKEPGSAKQSCSVCGFCNQPKGQCVFVWITIAAALALIIFGVALAVKKKNQNKQ
ncbi:MAG: hypothetical protein RR911_00845 [Oscillospiraceae bacterium]